MERMIGADNFNNLEKKPLLPPQTSCPSNVTLVSEDCGPSGSKEEPYLKKELINDQPASSESNSMEEQIPQWSQYITELENNIHALQAEGLEVLAQLQYEDRQNFMLSNENEVLKQRLNSMLHEEFINCRQNDMLRREVRRLHQLLQQRRPPQPFTIPRSH